MKVPDPGHPRHPFIQGLTRGRYHPTGNLQWSYTVCRQKKQHKSVLKGEWWTIMGDCVCVAQVPLFTVLEKYNGSKLTVRSHDEKMDGWMLL